MDQLQIFNYQTKEVRTVLKNGEPWFVAKDVCEIINLSDVSKAVSRLDEDEKGTNNFLTPGGTQNLLTINESGLYSLVLTSNKPESKQFKRWITHEVIPSIRKTGTYSLQPQLPQTYSEALRALANEWEEKQKLLPKAESFDKFISAENYQDMNSTAKVLGYGRNKLFKELRERKIIRNNNTPYQEYIDRGYFVVKEKPINMSDRVENYAQTFVTAKGINWLSKLLVA